MRRLFDPARNTIFLDMDGVLADFDSFVRERMGRTFHPASGPGGDKEMWDFLSKIERLYFQLEPMPNAVQLWNLAHSLGAKVEVLTAIPRRTTIPSAEADKREWIAKHFGTATPVRIGPYSRDKWKHASPADILVDDRHDNITDWINKGLGIGIFYTDFGQACADLVRLTREV